MMKSYEGMIIIKPNLKEEDEKAVFNGIIQTITGNGGRLKDSQMWAKQHHLAYSIAKYKEGTYYSIHFEIEPQALLKLKQIFRLNENILRVMITKI